MSETHTLTTADVPTVYFIDDSATMREVIKIAFRKENIHVITCADAASALSQFGESLPDAVITDVIMPDKDGYEVCRFIKENEQLAKTPVILMSGIVNQSVAEKATIVKADELIRKPFQPQDLVARVKSLMNAKHTASPLRSQPEPVLAAPPPRSSSESLSSLFSPAPVMSPVSSTQTTQPHRREESFTAAPIESRPSAPMMEPQISAASPRATPPAADTQKLRNEIRRLELLVKRLQAELDAGREYCAALESHFRNLQEPE